MDRGACFLPTNGKISFFMTEHYSTVCVHMYKYTSLSIHLFMDPEDVSLFWQL